MKEKWLVLMAFLALLLAVPASAAPLFFAEHTIKGNGFVGADSVYATDVDDDGDTDVLGAAYADGMAWWENTGGAPPNFTKHTIDGDFIGAISVYATDIDGDGEVDVLGASSVSGTIAWWENDGSENFMKHTIKQWFWGASSVYAADVDGDGDMDALGAVNSDITWWENRLGEAMPWLEHSIAGGTFYGPNSVYATDLDGDGDTDVLGSARGISTEAVTWWENIGGTPINWDPHVIADPSAAAANSVYATDLDSDGDMDVLGAGGISITWWENRLGEPTPWIQHTIDYYVDNASSVYATDLDGDGDTDVLGSAYGPVPDYVSRITWWENRLGEPTAWLSHTIGATFDGARSVYATDVDGDDDTDVLGAAELDDEIIWWENDASGNPPPSDPIDWTEHSVTDGTFNGASSVYGTDVDGDGDVDVLGAAYQGADVTWWENRLGEATPWPEHPVADSTFYGATSVYATDVDTDGDTDVLGAAWYAYPRWWENEPSGNFPPSDPITWTEHLISDVSDPFLVKSAHYIYATDMEGDGDPDVLGAAYDEIIWWENDPSGNPPPADPITWTVHALADNFWASSVYATDVDGDDDTDVLGTSSATLQCISWWENDGSESFTEHTINDSCQAAWSVFATDVDGDMDVDVLLAATLGITWWEGQPSGNSPPADPISWTQHTVTASAWVVDFTSVYAADMDGDGDVDVLGAAYGGDSMNWWENRLGEATPWIEHTIRDDLDGARSVYATDVDADGDVDVLGAAMLADAVIWWENRPAEKTYVPLVLKNYGP